MGTYGSGYYEDVYVSEFRKCDVVNNKILGNYKYLPNIYFKSINAVTSYNNFDNCEEIIFTGGSCGNTFNTGCSVIYITSSHHNTFGVNCSEIYISSNCNYNTFGDFSSMISLDYGCDNNVFGCGAYQISFGRYCSYNTIGNNCAVKFLTSMYGYYRNYCQYNKVADNCNVTLINGTTASGNTATHIKNYYINTNGEITLNTTGADYEIRVEKNSNGEIKQYCLADLIK